MIDGNNRKIVFFPKHCANSFVAPCLEQYITALGCILSPLHYYDIHTTLDCQVLCNMYLI